MISKYNEKLLATLETFVLSMIPKERRFIIKEKHCIIKKYIFQKILATRASNEDNVLEASRMIKLDLNSKT